MSLRSAIENALKKQPLNIEERNAARARALQTRASSEVTDLRSVNAAVRSEIQRTARSKADLTERFGDPDADQSAQWNTGVYTIGVPPTTVEGLPVRELP
jgi:hypothetical protein